MDFANQSLNFLTKNRIGLFGIGLGIGMGFELFKINFSLKGVSFYKVFNERQLKSKLDSYEAQLQEFDNSAAKVSFFSNSIPA